MAEFPNFGRHCGVLDCNLLDFLPVNCDACGVTFCNSHFTYESHNCSKAYTKNVQVPVCPLCSQPVPTPRGVPPDVGVNEHILNNCEQSAKKKIFKNKCNVQGCRKKELIPFTCPKCAQNYCIGHRHEVDHDCSNKKGKQKSSAAMAAMNRDRMACSKQANQLSEDEALARALAASLNGRTDLSPEELDRQLAQQLQLEENRNRQPQRTAQTTQGQGSSSSSERCSVS